MTVELLHRSPTFEAISEWLGTNMAERYLAAHAQESFAISTVEVKNTSRSARGWDVSIRVVTINGSPTRPLELFNGLGFRNVKWAMHTPSLFDNAGASSTFFAYVPDAIWPNLIVHSMLVGDINHD